MPPSYLLSVDLGTSHAVAVLRWPDGRARPLLFDGQPVLPVGVYRDEAGELVVGRDAARLATGAPDRFEPHPKRHIGSDSVLLGEHEVSVEAMFAAVLRRVATTCAEITGTLPETVLTCPSTWSAQRREVLASAAAKAGFPPVSVVTEPVAAAHYYQEVLGHSIDSDEALAVVDVGAGTVDIALLVRKGDGLSIVAEGGLDDFGGVDVDAAIVAHLRQSAGQEQSEVWSRLDHPETAEHGRNRRSLWSEAREAKEMLSRTSVAPIAVPGIEAGLHLTRPELDALARPLLEPMVRELKRLKASVEDDGYRLGGVFLVGGASRMPLVSNIIHSELDIAPVGVEQPDLAVAEGAATPGVPAADATEPETSVQVTAAEPESVLPPHSGPSGRGRLVAVWSAVAAAVVAAAALFWFLGDRPLSEIGDAGPFAATVTAAAEEVCLEEAELLESAPAVLRGPHFDLHVSCVALFDADQTHLVADLFDREPEMSESERLMVVHLPEAERRFELPEGSAHTVATEVRFGNGEWETDGIPEGDTVYASVVDAEGAATLAVTDAERTQTLDLRTGEIAEPIAAYYHGMFGEQTANAYSEMQLVSQDGNWVIDESWFDTDFVTTRSVFNEAEGYLCASELALITVEFSILMEITAHDLIWSYDPAAQLWISTDTETITPQDVDSSDEQWDSDNPDEAGVMRNFTVAFTVPAELTAFQLVFEPPSEVYDTGNQVLLHATTGDETKFLDFDFGA